MLRARAIYLATFIAAVCFAIPTASAQSPSWSISTTSSALSSWTENLLLAEFLNISTRVLSVKEDGCYLDAGSESGISVGQVFEIYRSAHDRSPETILGQVQVAWTREDYSFAEPLGNLKPDDITSLHFARSVNVPPTLIIQMDPALTERTGETATLIDAVILRLQQLDIRAYTRTSERSWRLTLLTDFDGAIIRATLFNITGEVVGTIVINPVTGERVRDELWLDPSYLTGAATPFEHFIAPPGRRQIKIACGNIYAAGGEELAILDGSDVWVYDLSGEEARLLDTVSIDIPAGPARFREDRGSLVTVDIDGNGHHELCVAPPAGIRGEIYRLESSGWVQLGFLDNPARSEGPWEGSVIMGSIGSNTPVFNSSSFKAVQPLSEDPADEISLGAGIIDIAHYQTSDSPFKGMITLDINGTLGVVPPGGERRELPGKWGISVTGANYSNGPLALVSSADFYGDTLSIIKIDNGTELESFRISSGQIIDITTGDIDRDNLAEIVVAVIEPDGVKIYY
ncbi:MAG TPA: hypothetical protein VGB30_09070 [bacterium]|jgi:hypothetical protein